MREIHLGRVIANDDPDKRGGIKVRVDTLLDAVSAFGDRYVPPSFPFAGSDEGFFLVPQVGAQVEVEVEADPDNFLEDPSPRYRAVLYSRVDQIPSEFKSDYPNRGGIKIGDVVLTFDRTQDLLALVASNVRLGTESATHPLIRGDSFNDSLNTLITGAPNGLIAALSALEAVAAVQPPGPGAPLQPGLAALKAAWTTFSQALDTWLSTRVRTE